MSAMWLASVCVTGFCDVFAIVGNIEFYISESSIKIRSVSNSLHFVVMVGKNGKSRRDWLNNDLNLRRFDYYYFLIAGLALINILYLLFCVKHYQYKKLSLYREDYRGLGFE
ncbi:hypothetical protein HN51_007161 [Arachis hypogaea]